jgi:DnaJ domain
VALFSFELDPHKILGIPAHASLSEIRDAYRLKAKIHHPDAGGEEWAFRVVVQAYEMLSSARVARAAGAEPSARRSSAPAEPRTPPRRPAHQPSSETVHQGFDDADLAPIKKVACELLSVRFLWDDAEYLWITQRAPDEERFLSCNINLSWPDFAKVPQGVQDADVAGTIAALQEIFDHLIITSRVVTSRVRVEDDRFGGWLCYSNFDRAWKAVNTLHELLRARGLGLRQWSRDLFIPRGWR